MGKFLVLGSWFLVVGCWCLVLGCWGEEFLRVCLIYEMKKAAGVILRLFAAISGSWRLIAEWLVLWWALVDALLSFPGGDGIFAFSTVEGFEFLCKFLFAGISLWFIWGAVVGQPSDQGAEDERRKNDDALVSFIAAEKYQRCHHSKPEYAE